MVLDISGIFFYMPVFSFLLVFVVVYALLAKTKVLGESGFVNILVSFILAIVFMSFSSLDLYVRTLIPWFVVLTIIVLLVLLIAGLATKDLDKIMTPAFAWVWVGILIFMFLVAAVYVFNPVFHPDLVIASGQDTSMLRQLTEGLDSTITGSILLLIIAVVVAWIITKK